MDGACARRFGGEMLPVVLARVSAVVWRGLDLDEPWDRGESWCCLPL